jgi:hypothetical protein
MPPEERETLSRIKFRMSFLQNQRPTRLKRRRLKSIEEESKLKTNNTLGPAAE